VHSTAESGQKTHYFIISVVEICKYQLNFPNSNRKNPTVYHLKKAKVLGNLFANFANNAVQGLDDFPTSENSPQNSRRSVFSVDRKRRRNAPISRAPWSV